jgi:hypothetical protein
MMNQAVTTSKPMLDKLSKTISSKLGNKPSTTGTPQHLQNYQNYQQHYNQQAQPQTQPQPQSHTFNPHAQQTPQQQQTPVPSAYPSQQSPYQHSSYSNGGNYFTPPAPATPQTPYSQPTPPPQQTSQSNYNGAQYSQGASTVGGQQGLMHQGQYYQGQFQQQPLQAQYTGQQMGVVGGTQHPQHTSNPQSPQIPSASPQLPPPQQAQWHSSHTGSEQSLASPYQQQPQPQQPQSYFPNSLQNQPAGNSQQWSPVSSAAPVGQIQQGVPPTSISPPPAPLQSKPAPMPSISPHQSQSSTPAPQTAAVQSPTEFIAELPADLGSLSIAEVKPADHSAAPPPGQHSSYQAYQSSPAPTGPSSPGFTIARRAVSVSSAPYADPWRFADPLTELPTREFYVVADLLFEALDRRFEPQNTGMLEASKVLRSWIDLSEDATRKPKPGDTHKPLDSDFCAELFSYNTYSAFARLWTLQGIPHVMIPCEPSLTPTWNFNQHSHAQELKLSTVSPHAATYATYVPALNRAGWYKFFFLEMLHGPDNINKLLPALCSETYKPGVLHHPDLTKRDKGEAPALQSRAAEIQAAAINQVCNETKAAMQSR